MFIVEVTNGVVHLYFINFSSTGWGIAGYVIYFINKTRKTYKKFAGTGIIKRNSNTDEIIYNQKAFVDLCGDTYLNRFSFSYIALDYLLGVFGKVEDEKWKAAFLIVTFTVVFMLFAYFCVEKLKMSSKNITEKITYAELKRAGVESDVESISAAQIDHAFPGNAPSYNPETDNCRIYGKKFYVTILTKDEQI